ncbi:MAG: lysylphosphatidylglycerol synthase domain-containing protein [Hyphomicrobiaceae bacterium]
MPNVLAILTTVASLAGALFYVSYLPHEQLAILDQAGPSALIYVALGSAASLLIGALRLKSLFSAVGHRVSYGSCVRVILLSQVAATFLLQLVGQLSVRGAMLTRLGVPVSTTATITLVERATALATLCMAALIASWGLFAGGPSWASTQAGSLLLDRMIGLGIVTAVVTAVFYKQIGSARQLRETLTIGTTLLTKSLLFTVLAQASTLLGFVAAFHAMIPDLDLFPLTCASVLIMLAAALPISFGGWGVRELSAIAALGLLGVSANVALWTSITVGVVALVTTLVMIGLMALFGLGTRPLASVATAPTPSQESASAQLVSTGLIGWLLPILAALLVAFQIRVPMTNGEATVNLADPVAIIAGTILLALVVSKQVRLKPTPLVLALVAAGFAIAAGYLHGYLSFGSNDWARVKATGYPILIAYGVVGFLCVHSGGTRARDAALAVMAISFVVVSGLAFMHQSLAILHLTGGRLGRAEGYVNDANAFAFQAVIGLAAVLAVAKRPNHISIGVGLCCLGVWTSSSKSGLIALALALLVAWVMKPEQRRPIATGIGLSAACILMLTIMAMAVPGSSAGQVYKFTESRAYSNSERLKTYIIALEMLREAPLFGKGLGAFVEDVRRSDGSLLVIHSSYLWALAEFGLAGAMLLASPLLVIVWRLKARIRNLEPYDFLALQICLAWSIMSVFQDMAYQRIAWLALGFALAQALLRTAEARSTVSILVPGRGDGLPGEPEKIPRRKAA